MKIGKILAASAISGMLVGVMTGCGGNEAAPPASPSGAAAAPAPKDCCKGKNTCKGTSGCKAGDNATCAGHNDCKGHGTSCPKPS
jgi:hypothetical protein